MRIEKKTQTTPLVAKVVNSESDSEVDTYSCEYINNTFATPYTKTYTNNGITFTFTRIGNTVELRVSGIGNTALTAGTNYQFTIDEKFRPPTNVIANHAAEEGSPAKNMYCVIYGLGQSGSFLYRVNTNTTTNAYYPRFVQTYFVY